MAMSATVSPATPARDLATLENEITELAAHIHAATYRLLCLIREFDARGGWSGPGLKSCAHWLNWRTGIALGAAREKLRVAHALTDLPRISEAFRSGRVSFSKVRAMTRVATPQNEDYLLMIATHGTASHVERLVRNYRKVKRAEALAQDNTRHDYRSLTWYVDDDGSYVLMAHLTPEQGARVIQALDTALDAARDERRDVSAETPEPIAARRSDALARVAAGFLQPGAGSCGGGARDTLNVHTDMTVLREAGEGVDSEMAGGGRLCAETTRRLACDAGIVQWQDGARGETLNVGRRTRSVPPAIRRALTRRDGGCRFPGCTAERFVDAHHVRHWADGGETRLDNLVLLCRHHHRLVHEGGFGVRMDGSGVPSFRDRDGRDLPATGETRFRGNVVALSEAHRRMGLAIGPRTPVPDWDGGAMDDDMAIDGLLYREVPRPG